jgi:beta-lactamase class A
MTGDKGLRAGLPEGWSLGEKTGSGAYGTSNDVDVAWTAHEQAPVVIAVFTTKKSASAERDYPLIAKTAELLGPRRG